MLDQILNISKRWCRSTPAIRRARSARGGIFDYIRAQLAGLRTSTSPTTAPARCRCSPCAAIRSACSTCTSTPCRTRRHGARIRYVLRVTEDRAIGLGACDIKGAAACLLAAAAQTRRRSRRSCSPATRKPTIARCIAAFLARDHGFDEVIVAEPTQCEAVLAHRGIASVQMRFTGEAGHASGANAIDRQRAAPGDALGRRRAVDYVDAESHQRFGGLTGLRFNIGRVEGGIKANMIAPSAERALRLPAAAVAGHRRAARALPRARRPAPAEYDDRRSAVRRCPRAMSPKPRTAPPRRARPRRCAGPADRQCGRFLDRGFAVLRRPG